MSMKEKIKEKFEKLLAEEKEIFNRCGWDGKDWKKSLPSNVDYLRFRTECLNLVKRVCGEDSDHYQELKRLAEDPRTSGNAYFLSNCFGVLEAAFRDFSDDFLFDLRTLIRADLLDDFLAQAEALLDEGYHVASASLAGAVLEDTLRKMCDERGITYPEKTKIDALNTFLAKDSAYNKLVQKEITAKADIRNNADHGRFNQFKEADVRDMVAWV